MTSPLKSKARREPDVAVPACGSRLNKAFETADIAEVCGAIDELIRLQSISRIAQQSGIERAHLYNAFSSQRGPRLSTVISVLQAIGLQLLVKPKQLSCERPLEYGRSETDKCPKPRSQRTSTAQFLNKAFDTCDLRAIAHAFGQVIRAQENVTAFAGQAGLERTRLYRCFGGALTPEFSSVLGVVDALDLQLLTRLETRSITSPETARRRRTATRASTAAPVEIEPFGATSAPGIALDANRAFAEAIESGAAAAEA
jgi:probable addiction module antidote protein